MLAADENLTARARQLRAAGVPGGMDELRALAYLGALGGLDPLDYAVPRGGTGEGRRDRGDARGDRGRSRQRRGRRPWRARPGRAPARRPRRRGAAAGEIPAGFAARVNLTVPAQATLLGLAERPGLLSRTGPVDPALARDLAAAAARSPRSTWCLTVTGPDHRPVAHGCGRPPPRPAGRGAAARAARDGPLFTPGDDHSRRREPAPSGWTSPPSPQEQLGPAGATIAVGGLVFALENLAGPCDHRHQANGHDPGVRLRHLTGILNACCTFPALPPPPQGRV